MSDQHNVVIGARQGEQQHERPLSGPVSDTARVFSPPPATSPDPFIALLNTFLHHLQGSLLDYVVGEYAGDIPQRVAQLRDPGVPLMDKLRLVQRAAGVGEAPLPEGMLNLMQFLTALTRLEAQLALPVPSLRAVLQRAQNVTQTLRTLVRQLKPSSGRERVMYWLEQLAGAAVLAQDLSGITSVAEGLDLTQRLLAESDVPAWVSPLLSLAETVVARLLLRQPEGAEAGETAPEGGEETPACRLQAFAAAYRSAKGTAEKVQRWLAVLGDAQLLPALEPYLPAVLRGSAGVLSLLGEAVTEADGAGLAGVLRQADRLLSPDFLRRLAAQGAAGEALAAPLGQLGGYYNAAASRRAVMMLVRLSNRESLLQGSDVRLLLEPEIWRVGASLSSAPAAGVDALWRLLSGIRDYTPGGVLAALRQDIGSPGSALMALLHAVCPTQVSAALVLGQGLFQAGRAWGRSDWGEMFSGLSAALAGAMRAAGVAESGGLTALVKQLVMAGALYAYRNRSLAANETLVAGLKVLIASSPDDRLLQAQRQYIDWWPALVVLRQQAVWPEEAAEVDPERAGLPGWLATVSGLLASEKLRRISGVERLRQRLEQQVGAWLGEGLTAVLTSAGQKTAAEYAGGQSLVAQAVGGAQGWFARLDEGLSGAANMALVFNMLAVTGEPERAAGEGAVPGPVALEGERGEGYRFLLPEGEDTGHSLWFWTGGAGAVMALLGGLLWWLSHQGASWRRTLAAGGVRPYGSEEGGAAFRRGDEVTQDAVTLLAGHEDRATQAQGSGAGPEGARLTAGSGEAVEVSAMTRGQDFVMRHFGNAGRVATLLTGTGLLTAALSGVGKWRSMQSEPQAQEVRGSASYEATLRALERQSGEERRTIWLRQHGYLDVNIPQVEADFTLWQRLRSGGTVDGAVLADLVRRLHSRERLAPEGEKAVGVLYDVRASPGLAEGQGLQLTLKSSTGKVLHEAVYSARGLSAAGEWHLSVARQINAALAEPGLARLGVSVRRVKGGAESTTFAAGPGPTATDNVILARAGSGVASAEWGITALSEQYGERVENPAGTSSLMQEFTAQRVLSDMVLAQGGTPGEMSYEDIPEARRARLLAREAWYRGEAAAREPGENGGWVYGEASRTAYTRLAGEMRVAANRLIVSDTARADWIAGLNGAGHQPGEEEQQYQQLRISELLLDSSTGLVWQDDDVLLATYTGETGKVRYVPFRLTDVVNRRHLEAGHLRGGETVAVAWWPGLVQEDASRAEKEKKIPALEGLRDEWRLQQQVNEKRALQAREKMALGSLNPDLGRFTFARWSEARIRKIAQEEGVTAQSGRSEVLLDFGLTWEETTADGTPVDAPTLAVQERVSLREIAWGYLRRLALQAGRQEKYTRMGRPGAGRGQGEGAGKSKRAQLSEETQFAGNAEGVARVAQRIAAADFYEEYQTWLGQYRTRSGGRPSGLSDNITGVVRARLAAMPGQGNYHNVALAPERESLTGVVQREYTDGRVVVLSLLDNRQWLFADRAAVNAAWQLNENGLRSVLSQRQRYDERQSTPREEEGDFQYAMQLDPVNFISKRIVDDLEQEADRLSVSQDEYRMLTMLEDLKTVLELASALVMPLAPASTLFGLGGAVLMPIIQSGFADEEGEKRGYLQEALLGAVFELGGEFLGGQALKRLIQSPVATSQPRIYNALGSNTGDPSVSTRRFTFESKIKQDEVAQYNRQYDIEPVVPVNRLRVTPKKIHQDDCDMLNLIKDFGMLTYSKISFMDYTDLNDNTPFTAKNLMEEFERLFGNNNTTGALANINPAKFGSNAAAATRLKDMVSQKDITLRYRKIGIWWENNTHPESYIVAMISVEGRNYVMDLFGSPVLLKGRQPRLETLYNWNHEYNKALDRLNRPDLLVKIKDSYSINALDDAFKDSANPGEASVGVEIFRKPNWYNNFIDEALLKSWTVNKTTRKIESFEFHLNEKVMEVKCVNVDADFKYYYVDDGAVDYVAITSHGVYQNSTGTIQLDSSNVHEFIGPHGWDVDDPTPDFINIRWSENIDVHSTITSKKAIPGIMKVNELHTNTTPLEMRGTTRINSFRNYHLNHFEKETPVSIARAVAMNRFLIDLGGQQKRTNFLQVRSRADHRSGNISTSPLLSNAIKAANKMNPVAFTPNAPVTTTSFHCRSFIHDKKSNLYYARGFYMQHDASTGKLKFKIPVTFALKKIPAGMGFISDDEAGETYDITTENIWRLRDIWKERIGFDVLEYNNQAAEVTLSDEEENTVTIAIMGDENGNQWSATRNDLPGQVTYADTGWLLMRGNISTLIDTILSKEKVVCTVKQNGQQVYSGYLSNDKIPRKGQSPTENAE